MPKFSEVRMAKKAALKRIRSAARLEASIRVDRILNEIEADFIHEFDRKVEAGEPYELTSFDITEVVNQHFPALPEGSV